MEMKYPNSKYELVFIKKITGGQVETVLYAKHLIRPENSMIIYNIDTQFVSTRLKSKILTMKNRNIDGLLGCFESNDQNLSFIKLNEKGFVEEVKEKEKISNYASTGLYIFTKAKQFFEAGEEMILKENKVKNEYYVSEIYNMLLKLNTKFEIDIAEEFTPLGTPNDLKKFEA
jgi:dTDP-glucose pyrophosphorylase